jgi:hypothetical protein
MYTTQRVALINELFNDMPQVHKEFGNPEGGVWRTDRSCYEFIASHCDHNSQTLETGLGLSTMLFVRLGTLHTCIAPWNTEIENLQSYCRNRNISTDTLTLIQGFSDKVLPTLPQTVLDLVLIDGGHGFPTPIIDWYYSAGRLRQGGILVIDDIHLPAVRLVIDFLNADSRWRLLKKTPKWSAYERASSGSLQEEHDRQGFWQG